MKLYLRFCRYFLIGIFLIFPRVSDAQLAREVGNQVPKFLSPDAFAFQKFINVPVAEYTGIADISIPIYSIRVGNYTHDISIKYHSGGIKVDEESSVVGLGWLLNAGGVINCTPSGRNDAVESSNYTDSRMDEALKQSYSKKTLKELFNITGYDFHQKYELSVTGRFDHPERGDESDFFEGLNSKAQKDIYSYSFCGYSGKFVEAPDLTYQPLNQTDILTIKKISSGFIITDKFGTNYYFTQLEKTSKTVGDAFSFSNSYYLTKIVFQDKDESDCITFSYFNSDLKLTYTPLPTFSVPSEERTEPNDTQTVYTEIINYMDFKSNQLQSYLGSTVYLQSIETKSERIRFSLSSRLDLKGDSPRKLDSISVYSKIDNNLKKVFVFKNSYFISDKSTRTRSLLYNSNTDGFTTFTEDQLSKRLRLDSLYQITPGAVTKSNNGDGSFGKYAIEKYVFGYDVTQLPYKRSTSIDHWGYYNGESNSVLVPSFRFGKFEYSEVGSSKIDAIFERQRSTGAANRGSNSTYMKACLLNKITYPTGGVAEITYEPNTFSNYRYLSSLELKSNINDKFDEYRTNKNLEEGFFVDANTRVTFKVGFRCMNLSACTPLADVKGNTAMYLVDKSTTPWTYFAQFRSVQFSNWNEDLSATFTTDRRRRLSLVIETTLPIGATSAAIYPTQHVYASVRQENTLPQVSGSNSIGAGCRVAQINHYNNNILQKRQSFKYEDTSGKSYGLLMVPLSYTVNYRINGMDCRGLMNKSTFPDTSHLISANGLYYVSQLKVTDSPIIQYSGPSVSYSCVEINDQDFSGSSFGRTVKVFNNEVPKYSQESLIYRVEEKPLNGTLSKLDFFKGDNLVKEESYLMSLDSKVIAKNFSSYLVNDQEEWNVCYSSGQSSSGLKQEIDNRHLYVSPIFSYKILKDKDFTKTFTDQGVITEEVRYSYDSLSQLTTRLSSSSLGDTITNKYYYPYNFAKSGNIYFNMNQMPGIVLKEEKFVNSRQVDGSLLEYYAPSSKKIYCPFKFSRWCGNSVYREEQKFDYSLDGYIRGVKDKNGISKVFIWGYNNSYPIAVIDNLEYSKITADTVLVNSLNQLQAFTDLSNVSLRNKLRILNLEIQKRIPKSGQITTYTYSPLIGMTSQTAPNGLTTYYDYDLFGRLTRLENSKGEIIADYRYSYRNSMFFSSAVNKSFRKNNCSSGTLGTSVNYFVPEGKYSSIVSQADADAKALAEVDSNGQTIANSSGTCFTFIADPIDEIPPVGAEVNVKITTNTSYKVTSNASWLICNASEGVGSGTLSLTVYPNTGANRKGALTFTSTLNGEVFTTSLAIAQAEVEPDISVLPLNPIPASLSFKVDKSSASVQIGSVGWSILSTSGSFFIAQKDASQNSINVSCTANTTKKVRTGYITITNGIETVKIPISQSDF